MTTIDPPEKREGPAKRIRHVGYQVPHLWREIDWLGGLGFELVLKRQERWKGRNLDIAKLEAPNGDVIELIEGNDWSDHIAVEVKSWPRSPISLRDAGDPYDDDYEVKFATSPGGRQYEIVKRRK